MELNVPYYHHELVKRALVTAAGDSKEHDAPLLLTLLSKLASSGAINQVSHLHNLFPLASSPCVWCFGAKWKFSNYVKQ